MEGHRPKAFVPAGHPKKVILYLIAFLFALHAALPVYINSSFLGTFIDKSFVGVVFSLASIVTIALFAFIPKILQRYGNFRITMGLMMLECACLVGLAGIDNPIALVALFVTSFTCVAVINFNLDVFLENISAHGEIGTVRGWFLTSANIAWIVSQIITGVLLLQGDGYWKIFATAALCMVPIIFLIGKNMRDFKDPVYQQHPFWGTIREIWDDKDILSIFAISFIQFFFYGWMVIYSPIYLHEIIGFSWEQIGIMFGIMLLPFVIAEIPLGRYIDRTHRERSILALGIVIMALATITIPFISIKSFVVWAAILFITRIGGSMVEISSEAHFFRHLDQERVNILSMYRTLRPWAYFIGPIIATLIFYITKRLGLADYDYALLFITLGLFTLYSLRHVHSLRAHPRPAPLEF